MNKIERIFVLFLVAMIILVTIGVNSPGRNKDKIIYDQSQQINLLRIEIRDMEINKFKILALPQILSEIEILELGVFAEKIKQESQKGE